MDFDLRAILKDAEVASIRIVKSTKKKVEIFWAVVVRRKVIGRNDAGIVNYAGIVDVNVGVDVDAISVFGTVVVDAGVNVVGVIVDAIDAGIVVVESVALVARAVVVFGDVVSVGGAVLDGVVVVICDVVLVDGFGIVCGVEAVVDAVVVCVVVL